MREVLSSYVGTLSVIISYRLSSCGYIGLDIITRRGYYVFCIRVGSISDEGRRAGYAVFVCRQPCQGLLG